MKFSSCCTIAMIMLLSVFANHAYAQKTIIFEDTASQKKIDKFQNGTSPITRSDFQKNDILIKIDSENYTPVSLHRITGIMLETTEVKKSSREETGFIVYLLEKEPSYKDSEIVLLLKLKGKNKKDGNKDFIFKIITGTEEPPGERAASTELSPCKIEQLKMVEYTFIPDTLMTKLTKDPCGGVTCSDCEPTTNTITYDFKTNKTTKNFPRVFQSETDTKSIHPKVGGRAEFLIRNVNPYLYDVTISDTTLNYNMDASGTYLGLLLGQGLSEDGAKAESFNSEDPECKLSDTDRLRKAVENLYSQLGRFYEELLHTPPYTDASCFGELIRNVKLSIGDSLRKYFSRSLHINNYSTLKGFMKANKEIFSDEAINKLDSAYSRIETRHYVYAYKVPEIDNVDEIQFRFNIIPKDKDHALPVVNKGVIRGYVKGGFKIDVSSGLYYGFMNNNEWGLRKDSIPLTAGGFQKGKRIFREEMGKGEFGFASFLHFYPRTGGLLNISGTIGAGLNLSDNPKPRYFGGVSILAGRGTNRLAVNLGVMMGNTTRISDQYPKDLNGNYMMLPEDEKELVTKQKFNSSFFISISYNLPFALKKTKMPQTTTPPPVKESGDEKAKTDTTKKEETEETESQSFTPGPLIKKASAGNPTPGIIQSSSGLLKEKTKRKFSKKKG